MNEDIINRIEEATVARLPFSLLPGQMALVGALADFVANPSAGSVFVLNGYAGTGKTSVMGAFVGALQSMGCRIVMLAPTGRAAKVASAFSGLPASTIHKRIFRGNGLDPSETSFYLAPNPDRDTLFIVDEASMISDSGMGRAGSLLQCLVRHIYSAPGCSMILVGDTAQLPPVGQERSQAMVPERLKALGLNPVAFTLDVPVRQSKGSGIVVNASNFRRCIEQPSEKGVPPIITSGFPEVRVVSTVDLADELTDSWNSVGIDETLVITRSNGRANRYNQAIRNNVLYADEPLQRGDRLVVAKNDYFWSKQNNLKSFIANGDQVEITWLGKTEKAYGRFFVDAEMTLSDGTPFSAKIMLRSLMAEGPAIGREEMARFYNHVIGDCEGSLSHKIKFALENPYYNAIQAKYAYCVTCHKAQGGQWKHVYVDMAGIDLENVGPDFYRWVYTAFTRATERLCIINPPLRIE